MPLPASDFTLPEQVSWADVCAALFCTLPFDWSLLWFTALLLCCGLREVFLGLLIFLDNLVIVVLQNLIQQPRPKESCLTSCGMPSGHAVICTSLTCWISCESAQRLQHSKGVMVILLVMGIHLPVLWAKVHLHDHTTTQVFSGAMAGAAAAWPGSAGACQITSTERRMDTLLFVADGPDGKEMSDSYMANDALPCCSHVSVWLKCSWLWRRSLLARGEPRQFPLAKPFVHGCDSRDDVLNVV